LLESATGSRRVQQDNEGNRQICWLDVQIWSQDQIGNLNPGSSNICRGQRSTDETDGCPGVHMSFHDDDLEQAGATRDGRFLRISGINNVLEWGLSGDQLEELSVQRCKDALKKHKGILSHLGLSVDIVRRIQSH
jgi:hypothetical protein